VLLARPESGSNASKEVALTPAVPTVVLRDSPAKAAPEDVPTQAAAVARMTTTVTPFGARAAGTSAARWASWDAL